MRRPYYNEDGKLHSRCPFCGGDAENTYGSAYLCGGCGKIFYNQAIPTPCKQESK